MRSCAMHAHAWRAPQSAHTALAASATAWRLIAWVRVGGLLCLQGDKAARAASLHEAPTRLARRRRRIAHPRPRAAGVRMVAIAAGAHHSLAVSEAGQLFAWGRAGRLGHGLSPGGDAREEAAPRLARAPRDRRPLRCPGSGLCCLGRGLRPTW